MKSILTLVSISLGAALMVLAGCGKAAEKPGAPDAKKAEGGSKPAAAKVEPAQAEGVWQLFQAVRDQKLDDFKKAWSKERFADLEKDGWDESFKEWTGEVKEQLGDKYELADFKFEFEAKEGNGKEGKVKGECKGKKLPKLDVILEDGAWKVDEN